jgi:hypothetical protein
MALGGTDLGSNTAPGRPEDLECAFHAIGSQPAALPNAEMEAGLRQKTRSGVSHLGCHPQSADMSI